MTERDAKFGDLALVVFVEPYAAGRLVPVFFDLPDASKTLRRTQGPTSEGATSLLAYTAPLPRDRQGACRFAKEGPFVTEIWPGVESQSDQVVELHERLHGYTGSAEQTPFDPVNDASVSVLFNLP